MLSLKQGWLTQANRVESPNFNLRPKGQSISLLVVHNISLPPGEFGGGNIEAFFQNQLDPNAHPYFSSISELQVSAHCLIDRDGQIAQFVSFDDRAWHAGRSVYRGREECNDYSIGIELEGTDTIAYTASQYRALADLTCVLRQYYPEIKDNIVGHSEIAPGRKTDPGPAFDWPHYFSLIGEN